MKNDIYRCFFINFISNGTPLKFGGCQDLKILRNLEPCEANYKNECPYDMFRAYMRSISYDQSDYDGKILNQACK